MQAQNRYEVIGTVAAHPRENVIFYARKFYTPDERVIISVMKRMKLLEKFERSCAY